MHLQTIFCLTKMKNERAFFRMASTGVLTQSECILGSLDKGWGMHVRPPPRSRAGQPVAVLAKPRPGWAGAPPGEVF